MHAVAGRAAGEDEVAGEQGGGLRGVGDHPRHVEDHVLGGLVLHGLAVEFECDLQVGGVRHEGRRDEVGAERREARRVLAAQPVGADLRHVLAEDQLTGGQVVGDGVRGDVRERLLGADPVGGPADDRGQFQLPVRLLAPRGQDHVVVGAGDRGRQADEHVRLVLGRTAVHHRGDLHPCFLRRARVVRGAMGQSQVDHVLPVVGAGLQHLARLDRRQDPQAVQRAPVPRALVRQAVQDCERLVPVLQQITGGGGVPELRNATEVEDELRGHQAGEGRSVAVGERAEGEGAGELRVYCHEVSSRCDATNLAPIRESRKSILWIITIHTTDTSAIGR